jgi:hypothetical protein
VIGFLPLYARSPMRTTTPVWVSRISAYDSRRAWPVDGHGLPMHHILWPAHLQAKWSDDLSHRAQWGDRRGPMTLVRAVAIARVEIDRRRVSHDPNNAICMTDKPDSW